jgi:hypothetical protein
MDLQDFVERTNIANFTKRLKTESDLTERGILAKLLAEEEAKQVQRKME